MPAVFIPQQGEQYKLISEWKPTLEWENRNLVLFRQLKLTGNKENVTRKVKFDDKCRIVRDANGDPIYEDHVTKRVTYNPLFRTEDGNYASVIVTFPENTIFELSQYRTGLKGKIYEVWLKVLSSPDNRLKDRCLSVTLEQFNLAEVEHVEV